MMNVAHYGSFGRYVFGADTLGAGHRAQYSASLLS